VVPAATKPPSSATKPTPPATPIIGETATPVRPAPASTPIIAIPDAAPPAPTDTKRFQEQLAAVIQQKRQLTTELDHARRESQQLKSQLASRTSAAADVTAIQAQLRDAQAAFAKQSTDLAALRAEATAARLEQGKLHSQLTAAREAAAAQSAAAAQAGEAATALERERAAHVATQSTLTQAKSQLDDLTAARAAFERDAAARIAAAERAQTTAAEEAKKVSAESTELVGKAGSLATELDKVRAELASVRQALTVSEERNVAFGIELTQTKTALEAATSRAQTAASRADASVQAESQLAALRTKLSTLERDLQATKVASNRITSEKAATEVELTNANQKLVEASRELSALRQRVAESSRPAAAVPDPKIAALQTELNETKSRLAKAERTGATRDTELAQLRSVAAAPTRPTISASDLETARRAATDAQQQLAAVERELGTLRPQAAAARELEQRVRQLEAERLAIADRPGDANVNKEDLARVVAAQLETENKLTTALRSYALVAKERDDLQARVAELTGKFSSTSEALTTAEAQARAAVESAAVSVASTAELETLRNRAAAAERSAEIARAELARANELLTAVRPTLAEPTRPTAPAGEPARTHTIAPGETLSSISLRYYGTTARWNEILSANRDVLVDERSFAAGRTLRIP
jgi:chromosome segregation ATPase